MRSQPRRPFFAALPGVLALAGVAVWCAARLASVAPPVPTSAVLAAQLPGWPPAGFVFMPRGAWSRPIPANPPVAPQSRTWLDNVFNQGYGMSLLQFEANSGGAPGDFNAPVYYAVSTDPTYTVHCTMYSGCPEEGQRVHIPAGARPSDGSDHHLAVVDRGANREDDFWLASTPSSKGGMLNIGYGGHGALDGDGTAMASTASGVGLTPGLLRAADLMAGFIPHALYISTHCTSHEFVYPAVSSDDTNPNCPPQGSRVYLDLSPASINALSVPKWTKTYYNAWHTYGAIVSDHGGNNFALMLEHDYTYSLFGAPSPWVQFAKYVRDDPASRHVWAEPYANVYHIIFPTANIDLRSHLHVLMPCVNTGTC